MSCFAGIFWYGLWVVGCWVIVWVLLPRVSALSALSRPRVWSRDRGSSFFLFLFLRSWHRAETLMSLRRSCLLCTGQLFPLEKCQFLLGEAPRPNRFSHFGLVLSDKKSENFRRRMKQLDCFIATETRELLRQHSLGLRAILQTAPAVPRQLEQSLHLRAIFFCIFIISIHPHRPYIITLANKTFSWLDFDR